MRTSPLTVCAVSDLPAAIDTLTHWTKEGLVSSVGVCSVEELAHLGTSCKSVHFSETGRVEESIEGLLHRQEEGTWLTLASLRAELPVAGEDTSFQDWTRYLQIERRAALAIQNVWHKDSKFRSLTVNIMREGIPLNAFSRWWQMHLIHDRRTLRLPNTYELLEDEDYLAACAVVALCAGGSWTFSDGLMFGGSRRDEGVDGSLRNVRLVRPEVRIVLSDDVGGHMKEVRSGAFPESPPWPAPADVETRWIGQGVKRPEPAVDQLSKLCGFFVEEPTFGQEIDLKGWLGAQTALKVSFRRLQGDPVSALWEWQDRVSRAVLDIPDVVVPEDGSGGFVTDDATEADQLFDAYMRDIEVGLNAATFIRSKSWCDFDFGKAVVDLRESGIPELVLGMEYQGSKWPDCWSKIRKFCFAFLDGSRFPEGIDDLPQWAYGTGTSRPIWSEPSAVGPHPIADESQSFSVNEYLGVILGVGTIAPLEVSVAKQADCLILGEIDPFQLEREHTDSIERHRKELRDQRGLWESWKGQFRDSPLNQLADRLGGALEDAYQKLADSIEIPDVEESEDEFLHSLTVFRSTQIISLPLVISLPIVAIALSLVGLMTSTQGALLWASFAIAWLVAILATGNSSAKVVRSTRQYAYAASERWRWAMRIRHYALELTRLHGVAQAFSDHQAIIRTIIHEPYPRQGVGDHDRDNSDEMERGEGDIRPESVLVASAVVDRERWVSDVRRRLPEDVHSGWLQDAYDDVEATWRGRFEELLENKDFDDPDDDYTPAGVQRFVVTETGEKIPGPREHFRASVTDNVGLRIEARSRAMLRDANVASGDSVDAMGTVSVIGYPAIRGSVPEFLGFQVPWRLGASDEEEFHPEMVRDGIGSVYVNGDDSIRSEDDYAPIERWGSKGAAIAHASFRMLVSESFSPKDLRGVISQ